MVDDRSSLSSLSSDNSVEEGGRRGRRRDGGGSPEYYSWDDWRERRKMVGVVVDREMVPEGRGRTTGMQVSARIDTRADEGLPSPSIYSIQVCTVESKTKIK